jgi:molybdopterin converting factor subunit 1
VRVRVRLFASLREAAGTELVELDLPEGATSEDAWRRLAAAYPSLADRRRSLAVAVNRLYARFDEPLHPDDEIVFVPPVSGGAL